MKPICYGCGKKGADGPIVGVRALDQRICRKCFLIVTKCLRAWGDQFQSLERTFWPDQTKGGQDVKTENTL